jgi:hypothetical protein
MALSERSAQSGSTSFPATAHRASSMSLIGTVGNRKRVRLGWSPSHPNHTKFREKRPGDRRVKHV